MQMVVLMALLVGAFAAAFLDARELFLGWYSECSPRQTGRRLAFAMIRVAISFAVVLAISLWLFLAR